MSTDYRPRIVVDIDEDMRLRIQKLIPWGLMGHVMRALMNDVLNMIEANGEVAIAAIIRGRIKARDILLAQYQEEAKDESQRP